MTRKKVKLSWIVNDNARKASLKKRKTGIIKKVTELHTLCDVSTFMIIFGPGDTEPTFWPPIPAIFDALEEYRSCPDMEKTKKMVNQEEYLKQRLKKVHDDTRKLRFKRKQTDTSSLMHQWDKALKPIDDFTEEELQGLSWLMDTTQRNYKERESFLERQETEQQPQPPAPATNMDGLVYDDTGMQLDTTAFFNPELGSTSAELGFFDNPWLNNQYFPGP